MEQAAKNADNFKLVFKHVDDFVKRVVTKIDDFGQQLDHLANRVILSGAEELSAALRTADNAISEAARNFRLNIGLEPQLIDGAMPNPPGQLSDLADRLQTFAKNLDDVVEDSGKFTLNDKTLVLFEQNIQKYVDEATELFNEELKVNTWVSVYQADEFVKTIDQYAEEAINNGAIATKKDFYKMYISKNYQYLDGFIDKLKKPYLETGASSIVNGQDIQRALE